MGRLLSVMAILAFASAAAAQQTDIIRGRVTGPDTALQGVTVKATSYQGSVVRTATTDKSGHFTLIFVNGEGDYWLDFVKLGFAPKRFEIKKIGDEEVLLADARLTSIVQTLGPVQVVGQGNRAVPSRNAAAVDVSGGDRPLTNNGLPTDQAGNLAAMAAAVAGIQVIPGLDGAADMYSLLGLTGDQNNTTFNGLGSGISALPPDILATTSISPYTFDVSKGGFSGAQIAIQTLPGSNFSRRAVANADIAPPLEWADAAASAQGQKFTNMRLGGNAAGPLATDKAFYNTSYNIGRRFSDVQTLLNTSPSGLAAAGVSGDSVARLQSIFGTQHIPATTEGVPSLQAQDVAQGSANFDLTPSASGAGHAFTLGLLGNFQRTQPVSRGSLLLATPAHGGEARFWGANAALVHSNYFWSAVLSKTTLGFAASGSSSEPYEQLPEGSVRVSSTLPDGSASVKSLLFGGNSSLSSSTNRTVQISNQLTWFSLDNKHTLKLTSSLSHDEFTSDLSPSLLGSFAFNSLADLETGRPSSYTRMLSKNTRTGQQLTAAASLGDYWRPSPNLQVQYGLRLDANRFLSAPALNQSVLDAFGVRNSNVPNQVYVSPRIGMQWYYGNAPQISYAPGSARPPRAVIHAGVGVFQNMAAAQLISQAVSSTGLANSAQTISCVGSAVPFPDWTSFLSDQSSIPTRCADGSTGSVFSTSSPNVTLFDPRFRQARSLRAAADWSGPILDNRFVLGVQSIISSGLSQQGAVDVNFNPATRFILVTEGGRPVFADPSAIVANTGAIATPATRVSPAFQHVWDQRSDLKVSSRQVTVNLKPVTANAMMKWDATYTLLDARESYYGFTNTVGNPFDRSSGAHLQGGRHTVTMRWSDFPVFDVVYVTAAVQLTSGQKYTPMIGGDVNGDGAVNDRAFVFDPAHADSATASAMRALLADGTSSARDCLRRQLNALAGRGSCQAPWFANAGLQIKFNPQKIGLPKRVNLTFQIQNPLGLADLSLHGTNDIHGWGLNIAPDQNLLYVRGFDPASRQFKYDVNQRFGSTRPQQSGAHALPYISLSVNVDIGVPRERQVLTRQLDIGRGHAGTKLPAESMKLLGTTSIPNPMGMILQQADSLKLTREQADSLATLSHLFAVYADSMWTPASKYLEALPEVYSHGEAYSRYVSARERTVDYLLTLVPDAKAVLTASQRRKLPMQIANYLDERVLKFLRSSTAGDGSGVIVR